jgi:hypothetical protein
MDGEGDCFVRLRDLFEKTAQNGFVWGMALQAIPGGPCGLLHFFICPHSPWPSDEKEQQERQEPFIAAGQKYLRLDPVSPLHHSIILLK